MFFIGIIPLISYEATTDGSCQLKFCQYANKGQKQGFSLEKFE